jgi:hypothetical protein
VASCAKPGTEECFPDEEYKAWLCGRSDPGEALSLFRKGAPWVRAYVTRNLESWDPGAHAHVTRSHLALDEEVVVLHPYKPSSGIIIMGSTTPNGWTSVDAVRSDGTCVSLMGDEITLRRPPAPTHAPIAWDKLDDHTRDQLLASPDVRRKADRVAKLCAVDSDRRCKQAKVQLTDAAVASSASLPDPN